MENIVFDFILHFLRRYDHMRLALRCQSFMKIIICIPVRRLNTDSQCNNSWTHPHEMSLDTLNRGLLFMNKSNKNN